MENAYVIFEPEIIYFYNRKKKEDMPMATHVACEYRRFSSAAPRGEEQGETVVLAGYNA